MPKFEKRKFHSCRLEPIERPVNPPMPGVPEHFNYGVFYDDNYDYLSYLKDPVEMNSSTTYRICLDDQDSEVAEPSRSPPALPLDCFQHLREPSVEKEDEVIDGLDMASDAEEAEEDQLLQDNFVELVGGHELVTNKEDVCPDLPASALAKDRVSMMKRFLYGDDYTSSESDDEDYSMEDEEDDNFSADINNRQFNKVTKTEVEHFDSDLRQRTLDAGRGLLEQSSCSNDDDDSTSSESSFANDDQVSCITEKSNLSKSSHGNLPCQRLLVLPQSKSSRQVGSIEGGVERQDAQQHLYINPLAPDQVRRAKDESKLEKKMRKCAIKAHRKERRAVRKTNQANFKVESAKQSAEGRPLV